MQVEEKLMNDSRFAIDDFTFNHHLKISKMISYEIVNIKLGKILRYQNSKIFKIDESDVYKYLDTKNEENYKKYCEQICLGDDFYRHNSKIYNELIKEIDNTDYDLKKGAIVINQLNIIMDGQHRACILLKKYGKDYEIPVVKIRYSYLGIFTYLRYFRYLLLRGR